MNKLNFIIVAILSMLIFFSCENDNPVEDEGLDQLASSYYPGGVGSTFLYNVDTLNINTNSYETVAANNKTFTSTVTMDGTQYTVQENLLSSIFLEEDIELGLHFRTTDRGVYFFLDTTGLGSLLSDSLLDSIDLPIDDFTLIMNQEIIIFSTPLESGLAWDAFNLIAEVNVQGSIFFYTLLNLSAEYVGSEDVNIPAFTEAQKGEKIKYIVTLSIPTDINDILDPPQDVFEFYGWFVESVGLVKLEGEIPSVEITEESEIIFGPGTEIREVLTSFDLK